MKLKKFLSILMVCVMGAGAFCACAPDSSSSTQDNDQGGYESGELQLFKSDYTIPPEERLSRIKAEYLLENKGYRDDDEVVAILSLHGDALIDSYLADEELSAKISLAEYAASPMGKQKKAAIDFAQTDLIRKLQSEGRINGVNYRYSTIANAIAVKMDYSDFLDLEQEGYCANVSLAETYSRPKESSGTDASAIVNAVEVYKTGIFRGDSALDPDGNPYTGKRTSVAVLDSGFDLGHQVFNTHKLTDEDELMFTRDDIRNFLDTEDTNAEQTTEGLVLTDVFYSNKIPYKYDYADKDPDVFPFDSEHGTHVAGIIGGYADSYQEKDGTTPTENGKPIPFQGIAVDTQLVLMKVFPDLTTGAETDDILAAIEDAVKLGVDAINMSLGAACGFTREKDGDIVNTIYDKVNASGTNLITAAGNEYSSGFGGAQGNTNFVTNPDSGTIGSPASYAPALSVASISGVKSKYLVSDRDRVLFFNESNSIAGEENNFFAELFADVANKGEKYNFGENEYPDRYDGIEVDANGDLVLQYVTIPGYGNRANYTGFDVKGKIALISRGDNTFEDKALQAKNHGAIACIIYNNIDGDILMSMGKSDHIPTVSISKEDGVALAESRTGTLTFSNSQEAGPFMSDFSCWGPLSDLTLKPEITAHGGNITSSVPGGRFDTISGTSMACPNLCGIVILIRQYIKDNYERLTGSTANENDANYMQNIKNLTNKLLMSTATIILNEQGNPYSPRKQGAGLASLYNVVNTPAYIEVEKNGRVQDRTKIELGDDPTRKGVYEMTFNIVNTSEQPVSYTLGLIGMTESVSTADPDHVAERDQLLSNSFTAEVVRGSEGAGSVSGKSVTVNGKQTLKLKLTYTLSAEDKDLIDSLFPYGMYVEGFVTLGAEGEDGIDLNVPFLAFYGDWTQAPIFDKTFYEVETEAHDAGIDAEDKLQADYYATTPYGSYWFNYIIPLGSYLYTIDESVYDPIPATEDRIAISDSLGTVDGISAVYAGLLRGCKLLTYTITDKMTGEVVYTHEVTNARKAFSQGGSPIPNYEFLRINSASLGLINNRQYEFKMVGQLDYGDGGAAANARNSFSFDFTLDNEAPIIRAATYEKVYDRTQRKDRYYINLTVYDNCYAMSVSPQLFTLNPNYGNGSGEAMYQIVPLSSNPIPLYGEKGTDNTVRIEITDYLKDIRFDELISSGLSFSVEDYALNQNLFICQLPGTRGTFRFTNDGTPSSAEKTLLTIAPNEIVDLTQYLATADTTVDADKDYLKYLDWESADENIAKVVDGQVLGVRTGHTFVTVTERMTGYTAQININVRNKTSATAAEISSRSPLTPLTANDVGDVTQENIKEIRFAYFDTVFAYSRAGQTSDIGSTGDRIFLTAYRGGISVYPGESIALYADVSPWYVRDKYTYTFMSDREDICEVTEDGIVTAKAKGNANITLRVSGSNLMATLRITVNSEFVIDEARTLVAYKGLGGDVVIPDDEGILYVGPYCFSLYETDYQYAQELPDDDLYANRHPSYNETIRSVVVPNGVTEIQQNAFYHCTGLEKVTLPDTVKFLRQDAFAGDTSLKEINLENVEVVGARAFQGCTKLDNLGTGKNAQGIPMMPKCYTVGTAGFMNCTSLTQLDLTMLRNASERAFMGCTGLTTVVFDETGLTKLSEHIFDGCGLQNVTIYESNIIPAYAFANNKNLQSVTLASGLELIGDNAFAGNVKLTEITLPDSAFTLGENVFGGCTLLSTVKLQENTEIAAAQGKLFAQSGVTAFEAPESKFYSVSADKKQLLNKEGTEIVLAAVGAYTGELTVGSEIKRIHTGAFAGSGVTSVLFSGAIVLGDHAFADCKALLSVTFAESGETEIGNYAFYGADRLATLTNLNAVVKIGDSAFAGNKVLKSVVLGDDVAVGTAAFKESGLTEVTLGKNAALGASAFESCNSLATVNMPQDGGVTVGAKAFAKDILLATVDLSKLAGEIGDEAFSSCRAIKSADLANVTSIGARAFASCSQLATVMLGNELTSIGEGAFMDETYSGSGNIRFSPIFTEITLPASLKTLGANAFYGCRNLTGIVLPDAITEVPDGAFAYCDALATVTLPQNCRKIGDNAFINCFALTAIDLSKAEEIGANAFSGAGREGLSASLAAAKVIGNAAFANSGLKGTVSAPALTSVGDNAFAGAAFTSFDAPQLVSIGEGAFRDNASLTAFNLNDGLTFIGKYAFLGCSSLASLTHGTGKQASGNLGSYAKLIDGVLYTTLKNGKQQLTAVPAGLTPADGTLTVAEGTAFIDDYAGNQNRHISALVLPDSLESIGEYAFYGYSVLRSVEFRSITAPALESSPTTATLRPTDPGYSILENQFSMYTGGMGYFNFIDLVGRNNPIHMILPANDDISGYDNVIYLVYFGTIANAERSEHTAMEQTMKDFLWLGREVAALGEVTLNDEALVSKAVVALNSVKQDPAAFGIDQAEWARLSAAVTQARDRIIRLKVEYAKKSVRDIQARIDELPAVYTNTEELNAKLLALREDIANLEVDDRNLLIQDRYTTLFAAYEAAQNGEKPPVGPGGEVTPPPQGGEETPGGEQSGGSDQGHTTHRKGGTGYSVLYLLVSGVTAPMLIGLHASQGWEMALWISLLFWSLIIGAGIVLILLVKLFTGKDPEKPFNIAALLGLLFSCFMPLAGLILSAVGKRREKVCDGGKLFYLGGFIVSSVFILLAVVLAIVHVCVPFLPF